MAITIQHVYTVDVEVTFDSRFRYCTCGSLDEITERVSEVLIKHNFTSADVCNSETGEVLIVIERS